MQNIKTGVKWWDFLSPIPTIKGVVKKIVPTSWLFKYTKWTSLILFGTFDYGLIVYLI